MGFFGNWDGIQNAIISILLFLDAIVYSFVSYVYQIFLVLANGSNILDNSIIDEFVQRLYLILGVVMLFILAYSLLKAMINPDEGLKKDTSPFKFVSSVITSVVLIALIPTIFNFAFDFQSAILKNNTIGRLILGPGSNGGYDSATTISQGGYYMASTVLNSFLHTNSTSDETYCETVEQELVAEGKMEIEGINGRNGVPCKPLEIEDSQNLISGFFGTLEGVTALGSVLPGFNIVTGAISNFFGWVRGATANKTTYGAVWQTAKLQQSFFPLGTFSRAIVEGDVTYYWLISTAAGLFVLYVLLVYVIDMAVRLVKLAVFELMAPIAILARIMPNKKVKDIFNNWVKVTLSTFTEVFIRIALLFFAVMIIHVVVDNFGNIFTGILTSGAGARWDILLIAQCLLILGVFLFVKEAPQILKDLGFDSGKYGKSLMKGVGMMAASLGGGATAAIRSAVNDKDKPLHRRIGRALKAGVGANARGLKNGYKTEKFGDIPKSAGKSSADTLKKRASVEDAGGWAKYMKLKGEGAKEKAKHWLSTEDDSRVQELAGKYDADLSSAQGVYKKTQAYIDAKAEKTTLKNKLDSYEGSLNELLGKILADNGLTEADKGTKDYTAAEELAKNQFAQIYGKTIESLRTEADAASRNVTDIENQEMQKKRAGVAAAVRDAAFQLSDFSDVKIDVKDIINKNKALKPEEQRRALEAYEKFGKLQGDELYDAIKDGLSADTSSHDFELAKSFVNEVMDSVNNEIQERKGKASFNETVYKSKINKASGDDKKK